MQRTELSAVTDRHPNQTFQMNYAQFVGSEQGRPIGRYCRAHLEQHVVCLSICALLQQQAEALPALHAVQLVDVAASLASLVSQRHRRAYEPRQPGCAPHLGMLESTD